MRNLLFKAAFDGSHFHGWQQQENAVTIQGEIKKAWTRLTGEEPNIIGCSRTDAGVHGLNYVVNFNTDSTIPPNSMYKALNPFLPEDIKAKSSEMVDGEFHAVYSAKKKTYRYYLEVRG
mgnify:CR=1 FL=1